MKKNDAAKSSVPGKKKDNKKITQATKPATRGVVKGGSTPKTQPQIT